MTAEGKALKIICDGACRGNPGAGAAAAVLYIWEGNPRRPPDEERTELLGHVTNNVAEHRAIQLGLRMAADRSPALVHIISDSQLAVRQVTGEWRARKPHLQALTRKAQEQIRALEQQGVLVTIMWVPREKTWQADALANKTIADARTGQ